MQVHANVDRIVRSDGDDEPPLERESNSQRIYLAVETRRPAFDFGVTLEPIDIVKLEYGGVLEK